jgi:hypothetical protein
LCRVSCHSGAETYLFFFLLDFLVVGLQSPVVYALLNLLHVENSALTISFHHALCLQGLEPTSFAKGCSALLVALAVGILLAIAVTLFYADDTDDFPVGAYIPVLLLVLVLPCIAACFYRTPEKPASVLPRSFEVTPRKLPVGDALGETGEYRSGLASELMTTYNGATTLREVFENAVAIDPSAQCQGTRPIEVGFFLNAIPLRQAIIASFFAAQGDAECYLQKPRWRGCHARNREVGYGSRVLVEVIF